MRSIELPEKVRPVPLNNSYPQSLRRINAFFQPSVRVRKFDSSGLQLQALRYSLAVESSTWLRSAPLESECRQLLNVLGGTV